jgi:RNA polymerase sigma-70 factor (ECF subfamily)
MPVLYNYIKIKVSGNADIEDILQNTMLAIWQSLDKYSYQSAFKTWIISIAKHKIADFYRAASARDNIPLTEELPDDDVFGAADEKIDLYTALSKLPEEHRELVYLVFNAGLTYE